MSQPITSASSQLMSVRSCCCHSSRTPHQDNHKLANVNPTHRQTHIIWSYMNTVHREDCEMILFAHTQSPFPFVGLTALSLALSALRLSQQQEGIKRYYIMSGCNTVNCYSELSAHSCATHHACINLQSTRRGSVQSSTMPGTYFSLFILISTVNIP